MKLFFSFFILFLILLFSSCATVVSLADKSGKTNYYSETKRSENNTVKIVSDVQNFQISYDYMNEYQFKTIENSQMQTNNGEINYYMSSLRRFYTRRLKVESPGYEPQYVKIKRIPRTGILVKDLVLSLFTYGIAIVIDPFHRNFYKVSKKSKTIRVDFVPAQ